MPDDRDKVPLDKFLAELDESLDKPVRRETHPAAVAEDTLLNQCTITPGRTSGPGGQHRNKVQTAITITHTPTGVTAHAGERRTAKENRRVAVRRLRLALACDIRVPVPTGEIRSELWRQRTRGGRIVLSPRHEDYPAMLAEGIDVIAACGWEPKQAAVRLGVSATQLIRMIGEHPAALEKVNTERTHLGMHTLRT